MYFEKSLEYFKIALPYIYPLRFKRSLVRYALKTHKFGGAAMAILKKGGYKVAKKTTTFFDKYKTQLVEARRAILLVE